MYTQGANPDSMVTKQHEEENIGYMNVVRQICGDPTVFAELFGELFNRFGGSRDFLLFSLLTFFFRGKFNVEAF